MTLKRPAIHSSESLALAVPRQPISSADLSIVRRALDDAAPEWSVELQGFCSDEATLVLLPEDGDDSMGPSFMVSRETHGYRLDQVHWDVPTEVGVFASMQDLVAALSARLACYPDLEMPASVTLH